MPRRHLTYREIADDMAARIRSGEYQPGARLPSYQQLATLYCLPMRINGMTINAERPDGVEAEGGGIPADTFAARLRLARMYAGDVSIRAAAPRCGGLNYGAWIHWEKGGMPRNLLEVVDKISAGLGVDRQWLLYGGPLAQSEENRERWISVLPLRNHPVRVSGRSTLCAAVRRPAQGQLVAGFGTNGLRVSGLPSGKSRSGFRSKALLSAQSHGYALVTKCEAVTSSGRCAQ